MEWLGIGEAYGDTVFRTSNNTAEKVAGEGIEEYFVYGNTIYYMQNGVFGKVSMTTAVGGQGT